MMAKKRKLTADILTKAGEEAHLQIKDNISHAKPIDGEVFLEIPVEDIENNPVQPRIHIDEAELNELVRSIKLHGLIQPIAVVRGENGKFILKAGQRRWLAHKKLGLKKIKAIVQEEGEGADANHERKLFEIAIMENTQRDNLDPLELALSLRHAMDRELYANMAEMAAAMGKSKSHISKVLKVLSLEDEIIHDLKENKSTNDIETLYEIQKIKDPQEQVRVYYDFIAKKIDRNDIRAMNKQKISHAKPEFEIHHNKRGRLRVELDMKKLPLESQEELVSKITSLVKEYLEISQKDI